MLVQLTLAKSDARGERSVWLNPLGVLSVTEHSRRTIEGWQSVAVVRLADGTKCVAADPDRQVGRTLAVLQEQAERPEGGP